MPSRDAEGQTSLDKFNSVGRNSLSLDIFSPVADGMCLPCFPNRCCVCNMELMYALLLNRFSMISLSVSGINCTVFFLSCI